MVDKEMLAAMEEMIGKKLRMGLKPLEMKIGMLDERTQQLESDTRYVKIVQAGNNMLHRQDSIEKCYADTSARYLEQKEQIDRLAKEIWRISDAIKDRSGRPEKVQA